MSYAKAVREFMRLYEEAGGSIHTDPTAAVRELFAAFSQARVFASEISELFAAERSRASELGQALEELRHSHAEVEASEERFRALVTNATDVVLVVDADDRVTYATPSVNGVFGCQESEIVGSQLQDHVLAADLSKLSIALIKARSEPSRATNASFRVPTADGEVRFIDAALTDLGDQSPIDGIVLNGRDVTERETLERSLRHAAFHDPLTGLPNRGLFTSHLETVWPSLSPDAGDALLLIDLDRFKLINDTRGHAAGDEVLLEVSSRLQQVAPARSFLARLGGDEFAMLVRVGDGASLRRVAAQIIGAFDGTADSVPSVSVGLAWPGVGGSNPSELIRAADLALYQAKKDGRARYSVFSPGLDQRWIERLEMESDLRTSVKDGALSLLYQPIVDMANGEAVAAETLVRWDHPRWGSVSPAVFIPLAEESDLVTDIGEWVLDAALDQLTEWRSHSVIDAARLHYLSVNVSAAELRDDGYASRVAAALDRTGVPADRLQLELTETLLAHDGSEVVRRLEELKDLGVRLAIDDFGTGYSSLSYLSRMPVDLMKVDRAFVTGMLESPRVETVVRATISLAEALGLGVVAEGVETLDQHHALRALGNALGQGYLYSQPLTAEELDCFMSTRSSPAFGAAA